jgi:hypothetical protein
MAPETQAEPANRERDALLEKYDHQYGLAREREAYAQGRIDRVLALHVPDPENTYDGRSACVVCVDPDSWTVTRLPDDLTWPCETVRILAGTDA